MAAFQIFRLLIPRFTDKEVFRLSLAVLKHEFEPTQCRSALLFGHTIQGLPGTKELDDILEEDTIAIQKLSFTLSLGMTVEITRTVDQSDKTLTGFQDTLCVTPGAKYTNANGVVRLIKRIREEFKPVDQRDFLDYLKEEDRSFYHAREKSSRDLKKLLEESFQKLYELTTIRSEQVESERRKLYSEHEQRQNELKVEYAGRMKEIAARESELAKLKDELDDRQSMHVRRELLKEMRDILSERAKKFELTQETQRRRLPTFVGYLFVMLLLATVTGFFIFWDFKSTSGTGQLSGWLIARQIVFGASFAAVTAFFLKWTSQWASRHAEEEFGLKRLELDILRASWVVEHALEWQALKEGEIPKDLIDRLSSHLFSSKSSKEDGATASETLADALLGNAASLKLKAGDNEIVLDHKGLKRLKKSNPDT